MVPAIAVDHSAGDFRESSNLDALRSLAVGLVLGVHSILTVLPVDAQWRGAVTRLGTLGVEMFFIHTSLVLMASLSRLRHEAFGNVIQRFYLRRAFRIYPLSVVVVLLISVLKIPMFPGLAYVPLDPRALISNLLLITNVIHAPLATGQLWSLPYEVQMYLLLPFLFCFGRRFRNPALIIAAGFAVKFGEILIFRHFDYERLLSYSPWFFMGVATYFAIWSRRLSPRLYGLALAGLVLSCFLATRFLRPVLSVGIEYIVGILLCLMIPLSAEIRSAALKKITHVVAKYSYGIYLSHMSILWFAFVVNHHQPMLLQLILFCFLMAAVPFVLYHAVEDPGIRVGRWLTQPRMVPARAATA